MTEPVQVEIVAYAPTAFYHCTHCEVVWKEVGFGKSLRQEQVASGLPEDLASDYQAASDWVKRLFATYGDRVVVRVIDAASVEGFVKSVRHGLRRFPATIVGGHRMIGDDFSRADKAIAEQLAGATAI